MVDALLVAQRSDVAHMAAHRERYADLPLLCVDPGILDTLIQAGFGNYQLRRLDVSRDMPARVYTETITRATLIDLALTRVRERLFGPGLFQGWDRNALYLPLHVMLTAQALRPAIEAAIPEPRIGLLRPDNPLLFNFDSMVPVEVLAADARRWSVVDRYSAGRFWNPLLLQACFDFEGIAQAVAAGRAQAVTHLATCFYDAPAFTAAVGAAFAHNIDLPNVYCDVPVRRERMLLKMADELEPGWIDPRCAEYRELARETFIQHLAELLPGRTALQQQADVLARRAWMQAVNYLGLQRALQGARPHFVVADHDNGWLGPLFTLAERMDCPVTVLPHSGYTNAALPHARRVTAVERAGFGANVRTLLGPMLSNKSILVTGGTGSFGRAFVRTVLARYPDVAALVVFSRDELKQFEMQQQFPPSRQHPACASSSATCATPTACAVRSKASTSSCTPPRSSRCRRPSTTPSSASRPTCWARRT
jgi:hypothetical protein